MKPHPAPKSGSLTFFLSATATLLAVTGLSNAATTMATYNWSTATASNSGIVIDGNDTPKCDLRNWASPGAPRVRKDMRAVTGIFPGEAGAYMEKGIPSPLRRIRKLLDQ